MIYTELNDSCSSVLPSALVTVTNLISFIMAAAISSVAPDQTSSTLLYFSPEVSAPWRCSSSMTLTLVLASPTISHFRFGMTMSWSAILIPARVAKV